MDWAVYLDEVGARPLVRATVMVVVWVATMTRCSTSIIWWRDLDLEEVLESLSRHASTILVMTLIPGCRFKGAEVSMTYRPPEGRFDQLLEGAAETTTRHLLIPEVEDDRFLRGSLVIFTIHTVVSVTLESE